MDNRQQRAQRVVQSSRLNGIVAVQCCRERRFQSEWPDTPTTLSWLSRDRERLPDMQTALENTLDTLATYFMQNGMKINAAKTELMVVGDKTALMAAASEPVGVQFVGETLQPVPTARNLGVVFDSWLCFEPHIDTIVAKCFGILIGLMHAKHMIPASVLPTIVNALVMSHVRYCSQVFGCANKTALNRLQKVQNFAARLISGRRKREHVSDVIQGLEWLPVAAMVNFNDLSFAQNHYDWWARCTETRGALQPRCRWTQNQAVGSSVSVSFPHQRWQKNV